jgi:adenylate kinase
MKRRVVLLGPPGSGKGTVAEKLETKYGLEHVSTGQWFRREMAAGTELGKRVSDYIVRGELVPDEVVRGLVEHWVTPDLIHHGFLLDGFPRTRAQALALDEFCAEKKAPLEVVLYLDCPEEVVTDRITGRRVCPACGRAYHVRSMPPRVAGMCDVCGTKLAQRADDTIEVVSDRLEFYRRMTLPLVDYYRESGKLVTLDAVPGSEAAFAAASRALES